jgi:hypothetical protein
MNPTTIPATDALLAGYCGPVERSIFGRDWTHSPWDDEPLRPGVSVRLPLLNPIALDHALRHLAAKGHPAWHLRDIASGGPLTAQVAAEAVAWSVVSVERGGGVLRGVGNMRDLDIINCRVTLMTFCGRSTWIAATKADRDFFCAPCTDMPGIGWQFGDRCGREFGADGLECIRAASLTAGFGLLNPDGLTLPALPSEKA